jgi:hypothetical protein
MDKTNQGLVEFCKQAQLAGTGYVYGTFGDKCTVSLLDYCAKKYPAENLAGGKMREVGEKWLGKIVTDCIGLLKFYMFTDKFGDNPHSGYNSKYDTSANGAFNQATEKGLISTIPEIPGICLHMNGHFGVYIGNGDVIEARGTYYGVVKTRLKDRPWTYWFKSPWIEYVQAATCDTTTDVSLALGQAYTFKVTSVETPSVTVGTSGVVALLPRYNSGNDRYFYLVGIGKAEDAAGVFVNGAKQFVARMK